MSVSLGLDRIHPSSASDRAHILRYTTTRSVSDDPIFDLRAGSASGTRVLRINKDGQMQGANGTVSLPTWSFESDKDSGFYRIGADNLGLSLGGTKRWDFGTAGSALTGTLSVSGAVTLSSTLAAGATTITGALTVSSTYLGADGSAAAPGLGFSGDTDNGLYRIGADNLGLTIGGTKRWDFAAAGSTLTGTLTVSGAVTLQSTLAVTGVSTLTGDVIAGTIRRGTSDGADDSFLLLASGGAATSDRGGYLASYGNEHANMGRIHLVSGNHASGYISLYTGADVEVGRFDQSATATHTRLLVWDVDNGQLERVTVGAADSGGAGFKVLRIPN